MPVPLPCSPASRAVGNTTAAIGKGYAGAIVEEIGRQFREIKGLREGQAEPEPANFDKKATFVPVA